MQKKSRVSNIKVKKIHMFVILVVVALMGLLALGIRKSKVAAPLAQKASSDDIIYYYGQGDNHSKKVDAFLNENKIEEFVPFTKKEVLTNKENSDDFMQKILQCGLTPEQEGLPFVYANSKCYKGDVEVIDFFKREAGIQ